MHKYAGMMFHQPSYSIAGTASQVRARVNFMESFIKALETDLADQMGISYKQYKTQIGEEWWMTAEQAARYGLVDGILNDLYYTAEPPARGYSIFGEDEGRMFQRVRSRSRRSRPVKRCPFMPAESAASIFS